MGSSYYPDKKTTSNYFYYSVFRLKKGEHGISVQWKTYDGIQQFLI